MTHLVSSKERGVPGHSLRVGAWLELFWTVLVEPLAFQTGLFVSVVLSKPTPVSALIHAATMVTAGVFMIARCSPLFEYAPYALMVITFVGAMTSFFAATKEE